jgi:hypothetical protein
MTKKIGKYIVPNGANVWPHEELTAKALIKYGHVVEFIVASGRKGENTPDVLIDGEKWEMKAPRGSTLKSVERNLKRGRWQSSKIVFDSRRMKKVPDKAIERELRQRIKEIPDVEQIKFVNRHSKIIDIT